MIIKNNNKKMKWDIHNERERDIETGKRIKRYSIKNREEVLNMLEEYKMNKPPWIAVLQNRAS